MLSRFPARLSPCAPVLFVGNQGRAFGSKLLQHSRDGGGPNTESFCQRVARNPLIPRSTQFEDRLQIIVDGFGSGPIARFRRH